MRRSLKGKEPLIACALFCVTLIGACHVIHLFEPPPVEHSRNKPAASLRGVQDADHAMPPLPRPRAMPRLDLPPVPPMPQDLVLSTDEHIWREALINNTDEYPLSHFILVPPSDQGCPENQSFVLAVISAWDEEDGRKEYRNQVAVLTGGVIKPVFFVGRPTEDWDAARMDPIIKEWKKNQDLVLINALDVYDNLAVKATALLEWFVWLCPTTQYVIKTDMDTQINFANLVSSAIGDWLDSLETSEQLLYLGSAYRHMDVVYDPSTKNYEDLPGHPKFFPPYNGGPFYALHQKAARYALAQRLGDHRRYYRNEDAMMGILLQGFVEPTHLKGVIPFFKDEFFQATCGHEPETYVDCECDRWLAFHSNSNPHGRGAYLFLFNAASCVSNYTPAHFQAALQLVASDENESDASLNTTLPV